MILRPPRSTRTDTLFPDTALFRSRAPIAAGIFEQSFVLGNPDVAPFTPHPPVEDDRCNLPAFACASSVTKKVAHAIGVPLRSEEHTSELQSLMRTSYAVFCLKKKTRTYHLHTILEH